MDKKTSIVSLIKATFTNKHPSSIIKSEESKEVPKENQKENSLGS